MSMDMFDAVAAQVNSRDGDKFFKAPKGWDASDPDGPWMQDYKKGAAVDYCDGFKVFDTFENAMDYAATLKWNTVSFHAPSQKWEVEPYDGPRG